MVAEPGVRGLTSVVVVVVVFLGVAVFVVVVLLVVDDLLGVPPPDEDVRVICVVVFDDVVCFVIVVFDNREYTSPDRSRDILGCEGERPGVVVGDSDVFFFGGEAPYPLPFTFE